MKSEKSRDAVAFKKDGGKASAASAGVRSILRTSIVAYARVFSTGLANVRSKKKRRARWWQN